MPIASDAVQRQIILGQFQPPRAGEIVKRPDGPDRTWTPLDAKEGVFHSPSLQGGYLFTTYHSDSARTAILQAQGHNLVYVNGEPRVGDPYSTGYVSLPVPIVEGDNHFLFQIGRGSLKARLLVPRARATIEPADRTLPDLVVGISAQALGSVLIVNASETALENTVLSAQIGGGPSTETALPTLPPHSVRKVAFRFDCPAFPTIGKARLALRLASADDPSGALDTTAIDLDIVEPTVARKITFPSRIDGSIQYYAFLPAAEDPTQTTPPGLIVSLHGASVEAINQARVYTPKPWAHLVAPTNRRPFGFDWEDWGRQDALEVLELAQKTLQTDPSRTWLTGHSMGGHGTWHLGVTYPDRFAAIAPSAGWVSMFSYAGARALEDPDPVVGLFRRAMLPSDTLSLSPNLAALGVYILHGDADDNVPVTQARIMRERLGEFHPDFAYHEQPGVSHWWGNQCCDWPPLMRFLQNRSIPENSQVRRVDFLTANPAISARCHWAVIEAQTHSSDLSEIHLSADPDKARIEGTTRNVARLRLDVSAFKPGEPMSVVLDGQEVRGMPPAGMVAVLWVERAGDSWFRADTPQATEKSPERSGPFKQAFSHNMIFVYGTGGSTEENAWSLARARYDAETFWYRGNGSVDVVPDSEFDPASNTDRSVILYGNADTHGDWSALLAESPVQVHRDSVQIGGRSLSGEGLACLFLRPRPGSSTACVGVVSGTGMKGFRLTDRLPYFVSGVAYPDLFVLDDQSLIHGFDGVRAAGYFGGDWSVDAGEILFREEETIPKP